MCELSTKFTQVLSSVKSKLQRFYKPTFWGLSTQHQQKKSWLMKMIWNKSTVKTRQHWHGDNLKGPAQIMDIRM